MTRITAIPIMRSMERRRLAVISSHMAPAAIGGVQSRLGGSLALPSKSDDVLEAHLWRLAFLCGFHFKEIAASEVKHVSDEVCWEDLDLRVKRHYCVIVELPRKRDLV